MFDEENHEQYLKPEFKVREISDGLAFGHGEISGKQSEQEILDIVKETVHENPDILARIDKTDDGRPIQDDGCGDGREVKTIFSLWKRFKKSLHRPKVLGGGVTMAAATKVGTGEATGLTLNEVFESAADTLEAKGVDFGAHTDEHAVGDKCGCGAIDKAPEAWLATLKYKEPISKVILQLGGDQDVLDEVYGNIRSYVGEIPNQPAFSGRKVVDKVLSLAKIVKQLGGNHHERRFVINKVRDHTVNQGLVREATDGKAQIFAVDDWRLEDIAHSLYEGDTHKQAMSYHSELVYTLAVAAVLTKGDLPVDLIEAKESAVPEYAA